jgi:type I restriction enzyme S subunit
MSTVFHELVAYDIGGGWGTDKPQPESESIGYVIRGTDIPRVAVGDVSTVPLRFHKASNLASRVLQAGDIVFEVSGGSKGQPVGRALQITDKVLEKFDEPVMCASFCKLIRLDPDRAVPGYVFRVLQAAYADGRLDTFQVQSTGITNFKWKPFLEHFRVELPVGEVQRKVATVLDTFDDLIENNRRRVEVLEEMARAIYREWFVAFRYPGHEDVPLVDSALGPIPAGWEVRPVREASAVVTRGIAPKYAEEGQWVVLNQKCIRDGRVSFGPSRMQERAVPDPKRIRFGDVLINSTGVGTLGRVAMYRGPSEGVTVDSHVTISRPVDESLNPWYAMSMLAKQVEIERLGTGATGQTELRKSHVESLELLQPVPDVLDAFAAAVTPHLTQVDVLLASSEKLSGVRDLLLPKMVTEQVDVSALDLDALIEGQVA